MNAENIYEAIRAKRSSWTFSVPTDLPMFWQLGDSAWLGMGTYTMPIPKHRMIVENLAIGLGDGVYTTSPELARTYLELKLPDRKPRCRKHEAHAASIPTSPPLLAIPTTIKEAAYVDIKSAYWSILNILGWTVAYAPHRYLGAGMSVKDFPFPQNKVARNSLISVALPAKATFWNVGKQKLQRVALKNKWLNRVLWRAVQDVLNSVALDVLGAVDCDYIHTDGYILQASSTQRAIDVIAEWGLTARIKWAGDARVYGVGRYDSHAHPLQQRFKREHPYAAIKSDETLLKWLKPRFSKLALQS